MAAADGEGRVHVWKVGAAREILTVSNPYVTPPSFGQGVVSWPALSPDGRFLATGLSAGHTIQMWDIPAQQKLWSLQDQADPAELTFGPDGSHLFFGPANPRPNVSATKASELPGAGPSIIDVASGEAAILLTDGTWVGREARFSADGSRVAFAHQPVFASEPSASELHAHQDPIVGHLEVWDVSSKVQLSDAPTGFGPLALSPDGQIVATSDGPVLRLLDADSLDPLRMLEGHTAPITTIEFSPDGRTIVTASLDGTARVWDTGSGDPIFLSQVRPVGVVAAASAQAGPGSRSICADGTILVQPIAVEDVVEIAKARLTRSFTDEECRTYLHLPECQH